MTEEKQPEQPQFIAVQIIGERGKSVLVQTGDFKRYFVPASKVKGGQVDRETLDKAVFHGIPWEDYLGLESISNEALALMLRQAGIYPLDDLQQRDRRLIRIGTRMIGQAVQDAARRAAETKPPRRRKNAS